MTTNTLPKWTRGISNVLLPKWLNKLILFSFSFEIEAIDFTNLLLVSLCMIILTFIIYNFLIKHAINYVRTNGN